MACYLLILKKDFDTIDHEIIFGNLLTMESIKVLYNFLRPTYVTDPKNAVPMERYPVQLN